MDKFIVALCLIALATHTMSETWLHMTYKAMFDHGVHGDGRAREDHSERTHGARRDRDRAPNQRYIPRARQRAAP